MVEIAKLNSAPIVPQVNRTGAESSDADEENRNLRILSGSNFPSLLFLFEIEMGIWNPKSRINWICEIGDRFQRKYFRHLTPKLQSLSKQRLKLAFPGQMVLASY